MNIAPVIKIIRKALNRIRIQSYWIKTKKSRVYLAKIKSNQRIIFYFLRNKFPEIYSELKKYNVDEFTTLMWRNINTKLEKVFLPSPPFSFLKDWTVRDTMFCICGIKTVKRWLAFLEKKIPKSKLKIFLEEEYVGEPLPLISTYLTSSTRVQHLSHLVRFIDKTGYDLNHINTVVEWGGGYGGMAALFRKLIDKNFTYIIIDIPIVSCIQWLYLTSILGEENVSIFRSPEDVIHAGKVNLIPVCFVEQFVAQLDQYKINTDLFISTWALSESSKHAQDYIVGHNWFGAKHILLAYQNSYKELPDADRIGRLAIDDGATIYDMDWLPINYYAFR